MRIIPPRFGGIHRNIEHYKQPQSTVPRKVSSLISPLVLCHTTTVKKGTALGTVPIHFKAQSQIVASWDSPRAVPNCPPVFLLFQRIILSWSLGRGPNINFLFYISGSDKLFSFPMKTPANDAAVREAMSKRVRDSPSISNRPVKGANSAALV